MCVAPVSHTPHLNAQNQGHRHGQQRYQASKKSRPLNGQQADAEQQTAEQQEESLVPTSGMRSRAGRKVPRIDPSVEKAKIFPDIRPTALDRNESRRMRNGEVIPKTTTGAEIMSAQTDKETRMALLPSAAAAS